MPNEGNKILKYNHGEKSMKAPFTIYADLECSLQKMSTCHNNPEKSRTTKINKHTSSDYSLFTQYSFDLTKNMLDCYRGKDCMEKFCKDLKEHATQLIYCKKKNQMIPLTDEENKSYEKQKFCYICKAGFSTDNGNRVALNEVALNKRYHKVGDHCHCTGKFK